MSFAHCHPKRIEMAPASNPKHFKRPTQQSPHRNTMLAPYRCPLDISEKCEVGAVTRNALNWGRYAARNTSSAPLSHHLTETPCLRHTRALRISNKCKINLSCHFKRRPSPPELSQGDWVDMSWWRTRHPPPPPPPNTVLAAGGLAAVHPPVQRARNKATTPPDKHTSSMVAPARDT